MAQEGFTDQAGIITVNIYDQTYYLSGHDTERVRSLAACVDAKMRAVAAEGRTVDSLRVAVLAALNLADELYRQMEKAETASPRNDIQLGHERAASLRGLLDQVLDERKIS
jgi:cell division protein ZapA